MLKKILKDQSAKIKSSSQHDYIITLVVAAENAKEIINYLKELKFNILADLTAVDYPEKTERFELIYNLLNIFDNQRIILKFSVKDKVDVETVTDLFNAAAWYEREVWDMFGINFTNNKDMRRILTDYGFEGHPLRKDFPLTGYKEVRYDDKQKKVIYEPVKLQQDFREFDFTSPWEGPKYDK